ncbi:MAG: RNA-binding protein [Chitinophagaceae bacterium]|nr:RNA-binding protein [Chitinophagaceae bacterium]
MINVGRYNELKVLREVDFGVYLEDELDGILLPKRFVPEGLKVGDIVKVFIYKDNEGRLIATTQQPKAQVGDIAMLEAKTVTPHGTFLDIGIMKDVFVPRTKQLADMHVGKKYLVKIYIDEQTNRIVASEKLDVYFDNENLTVKRLDLVDLIVYRKTDIGFVVIINNIHSGLLHHNDVFEKINIGDQLKGFIKKIHEPDEDGKLKYKIDVALGKPGFMKVEDESEKILRLLKENNGFLPYHDKSKPEDIYAFFGMSKKTFKMTTGNLFKQRVISFDKDGIRLI